MSFLPVPTPPPRTGSPEVPPVAPELAPPAYEKPCLVFVGSLTNLLGKSGGHADYTYRRPNQGRA